MVKVKVKQSLYRPGQALRVPGGWGSQISRQSAHEGGKVVSPRHRPPLPPSKYSWYSFLLEAESTPGPEGLHQWKIPVIPWEIEPKTFRLVAQCLNQLRHRVRISEMSGHLHFYMPYTCSRAATCLHVLPAPLQKDKPQFLMSVE